MDRLFPPRKAGVQGEEVNLDEHDMEQPELGTMKGFSPVLPVGLTTRYEDLEYAIQKV